MKRPAGAYIALLAAVLIAAAAGVAGLGIAMSRRPDVATHLSTLAHRANPVASENQLTGTRGWLHAQVATRDLGAYAARPSVPIGGTIEILISSRRPVVDLTVYRLGWYAGAGARRVDAITGITATYQGGWTADGFGVVDCPSCAYDAATGLLEPQWSDGYNLPVATDWVSGNYVADVSDRTGNHAYAYFVVTDPSSSAQILVIMPTATFEAYNNWGGKSLYPFNSYGPDTISIDRKAAVKVSLERPYDGLPFALSGIQFVEEQGYDVTYVSDVDFDSQPSVAFRPRLVISLGHDEYWSKTMFDSALESRDHGVRWAFLGGNDVYWQVRFEPSPSGFDHARLVSYRTRTLDPLAKTDPPVTTVRFAEPPVNRPQNQLTGGLYAGSPRQPAPWSLSATAPVWMIEGTGLEAGDGIAGILGDECDAGTHNAVTPTGLVLVGGGSITTAQGATTRCDTTYYATATSEVFYAGEKIWTDFLVGEKAVPGLVRLTTNVLDRFSQPSPAT